MTKEYIAQQLNDAEKRRDDTYKLYVLGEASAESLAWSEVLAEHWLLILNQHVSG